MSVLDHDYEDLRVEVDGQVAVLTFDRPAPVITTTRTASSPSAWG